MPIQTSNKDQHTAYRVLLILRNLSERIGPDVMCNFLDKYIKAVDLLNPQVKETVEAELRETSLRQFLAQHNNQEN